jgi:acetoin utilization deacetylase AcuC-like enzyme
MIIVTDHRCTEYHQPGHPERPQRVSRTAERLRAQTRLKLDWGEPAPVEEAQLLRAHAEHHLSRLGEPLDFDADTAALPGIKAHALRSVGGALRALKEATVGQAAFSLLRPPGHHATMERAMGFCYLNSVAVAALEARARGTPKVAVFDFDVHHGNGTEDILLDVEGCAYFSVHQFPAYPGTGAESYGNAHNHPVRPNAAREEYRRALSRALAELQRYEPALIGVSAGFDAYRGDPLAAEPLEREDYHWLGDTLRSYGVPVFSVLEGGYSDDLPDLVLAYLLGLGGL